MNRKLLFVFIFAVLLLAGCGGGRQANVVVPDKDVYRPEYAEGFEILGSDSMESTVISVFNPWQGADGVKLDYFVARNGEEAPAGFEGQVIKAGARRIVCMSSSYVAMLDILGEVDRTVAVSGINYISNPYVLAHKDRIKDVGPEMNYELLATLRPDVVLMYGVMDAQMTVTEKLREMNIPYLYMGEYLEQSPLGKAEWIMVLAEIMDMRAHGKEVFDSIPVGYNRLKSLVAGVSNRPTVMFNTPWNDSWVMPSTKNYSVRLVEDAGASYIYRENNSNASQPIGLETAYTLLSKADYWINVGQAMSLDELLKQNPHYAKAAAVRAGHVYNNVARVNADGANDYWESSAVHPDLILRDLITIFHPEVLNDTLYYYKHLK